MRNGRKPDAARPRAGIKSKDRKLLWYGNKEWINPKKKVPYKEAPVNSVLAAAVIRGVQALSGITRFKGSVGGKISQR